MTTAPRGKHHLVKKAGRERLKKGKSSSVGGKARPATVKMRVRRNSAHPWVYRRMAGGASRAVEPGEIVEVYDRERRFVGYGFYNAASEIALRLLSTHRREVPGREWFRRVVKHAAALRHETLQLPKRTNAYRLIHSEGDGLSGLIVDRYADVLALQVFCAGIKRVLPWVREALAECFPLARFVVRADARAEQREGVSLLPDDEAAEGGKAGATGRRAEAVTIREGSLKFLVDPGGGHKTGFFLDQRDNRARFAEFFHGLGGGSGQGGGKNVKGGASARVLDCFCYTGGFGLAAAVSGAAEVEAVDLDEEALRVGEKNRKLNKVEGRLRLRQANVFDVLRERRATRAEYSHIVLDPAKAAAVKDEVPRALRAYRDMNRMAMQLLRPGGILLSCSCSGLVEEDVFLDVLRGAAGEARAEMQVLRVCGAPADHPWAVRVPEGRYLKAVFSRISPLP